MPGIRTLSRDRPVQAKTRGGMESKSRKKILVAGDEASIRLLVRSTLEDEERCEIHEAADGREALGHLRANSRRT